jgi:hypothetical protein
MLPAISLANSSRLSSAHPRRTKPNRPYLKRVASLCGALSKPPLAALLAGGLASLAFSFVAHAGPVTDWNTIATTHAAANQDPGTQTHTLAIVHIATHDALNAVVPKYEPYAYSGSAPGRRWPPRSPQPRAIRSSRWSRRPLRRSTPSTPPRLRRY